MDINYDCKLGKKILNLFSLDPSYTNINHGSYGSTPISIQVAKENYMRQCEQNPDKWMRSIVKQKLNNVRKLVANYLKINDEQDLVFTENASDAFNAVAKGFDWKQGDKILRTKITYQSVSRTIDYLNQKFGSTSVDVNIDENVIQSNALILQAFQNTVENAEGPIKLAVIDHLSSMPSILFPVKQITEYLHTKNIPVVVDGAHAIGNIKFDINDIGADFYLSNFHKWFYTAKTASFLWISKKYGNQTHPNIIGNFYGDGLQEEFYWTGTRDFTSYLTIEDSIKFRNIFGEDEIINYMHDLAIKAGQLVADIWKTNLLINDPKMFGSMINIRCPTDSLKDAQQINNKLFEVDNTYFPLFQFDGKVYTRISCQIYNDISDFEFAATKFLEWQKKLLQK